MRAKPATVRPRRSAAQWRELVEAWSAAGQSAREFAEAHGVGEATLRWWRTQFRKSAPRAGGTEARAATLIPVRVVADESTPAAGCSWELTMPSGFVLRVEAALTPATIRALVRECSAVRRRR